MTKKQRRSAAARKAARTRKRNARSARGRRGARTRERRAGRVTKSRRRGGVRSLRRARRLIKRSRAGYNRRPAQRYARRWRMRSNPGGIAGQLMNTVKAAIPVAASLYVARIVSNQISKRVPAIAERIGAQYAAPAIAAVTVIGGHFATRSGPLAKYRYGVLLGTGINLIDTVIAAFAPDNVKSMFGLAPLGDSGIYDEALQDYIGTGEYEGSASGEGYESMADYVDLEGVDSELSGLQDENGFGDLGATAMSGRRRRYALPGAGGSFGADESGEGTSLYTGVFAKQG